MVLCISQNWIFPLGIKIFILLAYTFIFRKVVNLSQAQLVKVIVALLLLKVALLNLITISSTWARVIDVMDSEVYLQ